MAPRRTRASAIDEEPLTSEPLSQALSAEHGRSSTSHHAHDVSSEAEAGESGGEEVTERTCDVCQRRDVMDNLVVCSACDSAGR